MNPHGIIYHYNYSITPPPRDESEEQWAIQKVWGKLTQLLGVFVVRCPCHIFSPCGHGDITLTAQGDDFSETRIVQVEMYQKYRAEQVNSGLMGEAEVVAQHIIKKLSGVMLHCKVGRRYFNNFDANGGKAQLTIYSGFWTAMHTLNDNGPQMQVDMMYRALHKKNIIEELHSSLDLDPLLTYDSEVSTEWLRRCVGTTVVTQYNNKVYRIKNVHFNMTPHSNFMMVSKETKKREQMNFMQFYKSYYAKAIECERQPMLEAYREEESDMPIFLVPELCSLTGFSDDMRKDKNLMTEALKQSKVSPQERFNATTLLVSDMASKATSGSSTGQGHPRELELAKTMEDWNFTVDKSPLEVEARIFDPLEVTFGSKKYSIEDASFTRWIRNGLMCPVRLEEWLFIYPEADVPVLDIWLRSLKDIAQVAFNMFMADPKKLVCSDQKTQLLPMLQNHVKPNTRLVLLLTPQKDAKKVYQAFKQMTSTTYPCITQVVKSETIRKRQSIATVLMRIVLQINAKLCGPLWHMDLEAPCTAPLFTYPTMVIGIDVHHSCEGTLYVGFVASLNTQCSEYYSMASELDMKSVWKSMSEKIQDYTREAFLTFAEKNDGILPEHILVYRASINQEDWPNVKAAEIDAIRRVFSAVKNKAKAPYEPKLTVVAISKRVGMRFFCPNPDKNNIKNPDPGTVVDCPDITGSETRSFYLINQAIGKGTAAPTHYTVLYDNANLSPNALQNISHRLSYLYYNSIGSVKMPAPAQYAKKIAALIGTAVKLDPHKRLRNSLFYL
eukprot:CAMPEP_0180441470 /NCGR_PEP_ID=MMETSP1036_2-20121128/13643_1 /TAXON_ID=632150 /ORGANISM="Azadinium spinosum, Strain 3D9" /LENGTH=781 /DNA_ID=CAMNT_0022447687 /DNA_START=176 /DNA_END=2521 /DNA_ORIENTATION=+